MAQPFKEYLVQHLTEFLPQELKDTKVSLSQSDLTGFANFTKVMLEGPAGETFKPLYLEDFARYPEYICEDEYDAFCRKIADEAYKSVFKELFERNDKFALRHVRERSYIVFGKRGSFEKDVSSTNHEFEIDEMFMLGDRSQPLPVSAGLLERLHLSFEDVRNMSMRNMRMKDPPRLYCIDRQLMTFEPITSAKSEGTGDASSLALIICSNTDRKYGSTSILYPEVCEKISALTKGDYYIFASSKDFFTCVGANVPYATKKIKQMLNEYNMGLYDPETILTKKVYKYRSMVKKIEET